MLMSTLLGKWYKYVLISGPHQHKLAYLVICIYNNNYLSKSTHCMNSFFPPEGWYGGGSGVQLSYLSWLETALWTILLESNKYF